MDIVSRRDVNAICETINRWVFIKKLAWHVVVDTSQIIKKAGTRPAFGEWVTGESESRHIHPVPF